MRKYLALDWNGDPYDSGFTATEMTERRASVGIYRGDIGARSRAWWRSYARRNGFVLIEAGRG